MNLDPILTSRPFKHFNPTEAMQPGTGMLDGESVEVLVAFIAKQDMIQRNVNIETK